MKKNILWNTCKAIGTLLLFTFALPQMVQAQSIYLGGNYIYYGSDKTIEVGGGIMSWDSKNAVITVKNVKLEGFAGSFINLNNLDLGKTVKIILEGENTVESSIEIFTWNTCDVEISGTGSLTARTTSEYAFHQNDTKDCTLIIKDCAIDIQGSANSLISYYNGDGTQVLNLVLDNATLKVKGSTGGWGWRYAGIESLKSVQLKNCHIETPGVRFGQQNGLTSYELLGEDDDTYYGEVSIVPGNGGETGITCPEASAAVSARVQGIYNMQGVRLGISPDALPKGIYIVDGKKVVKK